MSAPRAPARSPTQKSATSKNGVWRKRKPSAATARKASSRPNAKPPKYAARPRKSVTGRTRKPSARLNSKPRSVLAKPRPGPPPQPARAPGIAADISDEDEGPRQVRRGPGGVVRPAAAPKTTAKPAPQKQRGRLTLVTALNADDVRERSIASFRRRTQRLKGHQSNEPKEKLVREVTIPEVINIQELANRMSERAVDVIKLLMKQGAM